jgi:hypothetical protein
VGPTTASTPRYIYWVPIAGAWSLDPV